VAPGEQELTIHEKLLIAERAVGHTFRDRSLLRQAVTHPSAVNDSVHESFERLEFLGDSIIGAVVAEEVFRRFPHMHEGGMTRIRISLVAGPILASAAQSVGLEEAIVLGESEIKTGKRGRASALEDTYEAITAALYLDAGIDVAREWVLRTLGPLIREDVATTPANPKSALQEAVQSFGTSAIYKITGHEGPPHDRSFTAVVEVGGKVVGQGYGRTKREAEAEAAAAAIEAMEL
jgi:ribonuclease-3